MADLKIDEGELTVSAARARVIASEFASAERVADDIAGATGHDGLAAKVRQFGDNWDIARDRLQKSLQHVSDVLTAVVDTFNDLDTDLSQAVSAPIALDKPAPQEPSPAPAPAQPAPVPTPSPGPSPTPPGGDR